MEEQKCKRVLSIELDDDVKKVSITGTNGEEKVVMRQELDEDELNNVAGGACAHHVILGPEWKDYFEGISKP